MSGIVGGTAQNLNVRNNVYDDDPGVLAWVPETQPLIKTDTLNVNSDVTDRAARLLGVVSLPDPTTAYKITDIDPTDGNSYFGYTDAGDKWYIMNLTTTTARYIKGDSGYIAAWAGKAGLSYDYFYNVF